MMIDLSSVRLSSSKAGSTSKVAVFVVRPYVAVKVAVQKDETGRVVTVATLVVWPAST